MAYFLMVKTIRSSRRGQRVQDYRREFADEMEKIKRGVKANFEAVTADWKNKPTFVARKYITGEGFRITCSPRKNKAGQIFHYVNKGTPPHVIRPKRAKALRFRLGYKPRTFPGPARIRVSGGGGKATGKVVFAKIVHHPGTKAREFDKAIMAYWKPEFRRRMNNTFRRIARRSK